MYIVSSGVANSQKLSTPLARLHMRCDHTATHHSKVAHTLEFATALMRSGSAPVQPQGSRLMVHGILPDESQQQTRAPWVQTCRRTLLRPAKSGSQVK